MLRVLAQEHNTGAATLAPAAILQAPSLTRILKELNERGLIARRSDPVDARRSIVEISKKGQVLMTDTAVHTATVIARYDEACGR